MPTVNWNKRWGEDLRRVLHSDRVSYYGEQWGDPSISGFRYWLLKLVEGRKIPGDLSRVVHYYIEPYVTAETVALEIGPGGGRWTQYLLAAREVILVDLNPEFFPYLEKRFPRAVSKMRFYGTEGCDLNRIMSNYVDYVFSFGSFVHIDPEGIDSYLRHIKRVLRLGGIATIQYGDKTKKLARQNSSFSNMDPKKMEGFVFKHGFKLLQNNLSLLNHSNIAVFQK